MQCDDAACDVAQWTSLGASGDIQSLLTVERTTNARHLLRLHHDAFMFHQANLRWEGVGKNTVNGISGQYSLLQMWVETVVAEVTRLVTWPIITLKHDDVSFHEHLPLFPRLTNGVQNIAGSNICETND